MASLPETPLYPRCWKSATFPVETHNSLPKHSVFITESLPINCEAEHVLLQKKKDTGELQVVLCLFQGRLLGWNLSLLFDFFLLLLIN